MKYGTKSGKAISLAAFIAYLPQYVSMVLSKKSYQLAFTTTTLSFTLSTIAVELLIYLLRYQPKKARKTKQS